MINSKTSKKLLLRDLIISTLIVLLPVLFYLYKLAPMTSSAVIFGIEINTSYYSDVQTFLWALSTKILTLFAFIIWFLTCRHWWKYSILIPIFIELYKLFGVLNDSQGFMDEYELVSSLPLSIPIVILLIYISNKLKYYSMTNVINERIELDMNDTIAQIIKTKYSNFKIAKEKYEVLKKNKPKMNKDEYLRQLVILSNELKME
ncbi:MAG: hypothetical protein HKO81_06605 [Flavobacteriaceae bacterium]|nr:hypothetical protein [Bacteroidia bacterium]NNL16296.1 hypothetical protein [Flavobacteriaceae bacterium]